MLPSLRQARSTTSRRGRTDRVPTDPVCVAVALADKIDTLVGFWTIDEKPTGSKDPYALRRAALGVIRLIVENGLRLSLWRPLSEHAAYSAQILYREDANLIAELSDWIGDARDVSEVSSNSFSNKVAESNFRFLKPRIHDLLAFFADRLKVQLREQGARHDLVDAVFALEGQDDLLMVVRRVEALGKFLDTDDGKNLLAGTKRAANILAHRGEKGQAGV